MRLPVVFATVSAVMWGLWWIPIRYLEALGFSGILSGAAMAAGALVVVALWTVVTRPTLRVSPISALGACIVGLCFTLFAAALAETDVIRATLLFYLSPVWGKLIEWRFLGRGWPRWSYLTLFLALAGAFCITGADVSFEGIGAGDVMALASGILWAIGATLVFSGGAAVSTSTLSMLTCVGAIATGMVFGVFDGIPTITTQLASHSLGLGALFVTPMIVLTLWSAQRLSPALLTFLLTAEILTGVLSAVLLLDEPFGPIQAAGVGLILAGIMSEVFMSMRRVAA